VPIAVPVSPILQPRRTATVRSPYDVNETLARAMPAQDRGRLEAQLERSRRFEPVDHRGFQIAPEEFALSVAVAHTASTRISASVMRRGMAMTIAEPGGGTYTFGMRRHGAISLSGCGRSVDGTWGGVAGTVYQEREGARIATSDDYSGVSFEIPRARLIAVLEGLIERPIVGDVAFAPAVSPTSGPGARLARLVAFIEQEVASGDSLLDQAITAPAMEELLIRALLDLPHAYSGSLEREASSAAPYNVVRAEHYMRLHVGEAISIDQIAAAAGCSVRALQVAFRRFRGRTPTDELRRIRLEQAHREMLNSPDAQTIMAIAARYGFSNPGRFAAQYRRMFGQSPSRLRTPGKT
jgi:AraC-like DNA-binding protein